MKKDITIKFENDSTKTVIRKELIVDLFNQFNHKIIIFSDLLVSEKFVYIKFEEVKKMIKVLVPSYSDASEDIMGLLGIELKDCVYEIEENKFFQAIKDTENSIAITYDKDIDTFKLWSANDL